ncbi:MAG TPA: type IV toxin-antitoxin system AbiEi family antitoxin domain-containing protein [Conexibacter sp.]|nr:type IV toxin-antitoxin system AbiEi family antitoxin domain-containing protein [Conexibacter sp.]
MVAALAARQHGVVARRQLLDAGLTREMVQRRLENGHLVPLHRGVYAVGHRRLRREGFWLAAVLAAGPGAVLSHREAAALHGLRPSERSSVDVTVAARRRVPGIHLHSVEHLDAEDTAALDGIPVTTVDRTLVDLAAIVSRDQLRKALEEAERSHRLDVTAIEAVLARTRGRNGRGHQRIRRALQELASTGTTVTRSVLEERFAALLDAHGLPRPSANAWTAGMEVDAVWPTARLAVELDGWDGHKTRAAFQRDRTRSNDLQAAGWTILRFTHADVVHGGADTAARIGRELAQAATATG